MMKLFSTALCLFLCICLSSCQDSNSGKDNNGEIGSSYDEAYFSGYEEGLYKGAYECKIDFANAIRDRYSDVESATLNERYLHPEEAIMVLNDYLDGKYVSDNEMENAIESLTDFYYDWQSVIAKIDDFDVDVHFDDEYIYLD